MVERSESTPPAQRTSGSSRFAYQFLNCQPWSQNSHTDQGSPGRASFSTPVPNQRSRCTVRGLVYRVASGSRCTGVPSASTGLTHSVPGAIHTASSSGSSRTTVTGRAMWKRAPPFSRYRHRICVPGAQKPAAPPASPRPAPLTAPPSVMRRY
ncbi:hypothetical protein SGRIM128S_06202 [Streptomyces griseomycini]